MSKRPARRSAAVLLAALLLCLTARSATATEEEAGGREGRPFVVSALLYLPNRLLDVGDLFRFGLDVGPGLGFDVQVTRLLQAKLLSRFSIGRRLPDAAPSSGEGRRGRVLRRGSDRGKPLGRARLVPVAERRAGGIPPAAGRGPPRRGSDRVARPAPRARGARPGRRRSLRSRGLGGSFGLFIPARLADAPERGGRSAVRAPHPVGVMVAETSRRRGLCRPAPPVLPGRGGAGGEAAGAGGGDSCRRRRVRPRGALQPVREGGVGRRASGRGCAGARRAAAGGDGSRPEKARLGGVGRRPEHRAGADPCAPRGLAEPARRRPRRRCRRTTAPSCERVARDTWRGLDALRDRENGLPVDHVRFDAAAPSTSSAPRSATTRASARSASTSPPSSRRTSSGFLAPRRGAWRASARCSRR